VVFASGRPIPSSAASPTQRLLPSGPADNLTFGTILGGLGLTPELANTGTTDLGNLTASITLANPGAVRIRPDTYPIPLLAAGKTIRFHIRVWGVGLGRHAALPQIQLAVYTDQGQHAAALLTVRVLGPFTRIQSISYEGEDYPGYILYSPEYSTKTLLMDKNGTIRHTWESPYIQGLGISLLENGDLLRTAMPNVNPVFISGGVTGRVERYDWNGTLTWGFNYSTPQHCLHHDIAMLPDGDILMVAWEYKTAQEAIAAGRDPSSLPLGELWPDHVIEVRPTGPASGDIVWQWHIWDHLIQDYDSTKANYGNVTDHPELLDINYGIHEGRDRADWNHINAIDYNPKFDQILLSVHNQREIWIIDHSTTTQEATGHTGGRSGHGGDLLYRWGNPRTYRRGTSQDQQLFGQHDAQWIPPGCPGEGDILLFNNGEGRPEGQYSTVDELRPPVDDNGTYTLIPGSAYGPSQPLWSYQARDPFDFYAGYLSSAQRLPTGTTLICDGDHGLFLEVTPEGNTVWEYRNRLPDPVDNQVFKAVCYAPSYPGLHLLPP